jgi:hypothetical protein
MSTRELIASLIKADVPVLLSGAPGTGKTAMLEGLAREQGAYIETLIGSTVDPADVGGYLVPSGGGVTSVPPPWATRLRERADSGVQSWLFLDELTCCPASVRAALLRVVCSRAVGSMGLDGVRMVAACNPPEQAEDGGDLGAPMANRFAHVDWAPDPAAWAEGELSGWGSGHAVPQLGAASASVSSWIKHKPSALLQVPVDGAAAGRAWPSPRSWSAAARAMAFAPAGQVRAAVTACVGVGGAAEFSTWLSNMDLPDPEAVLAGTAKVPTRGDAQAATLSAVVAAAMADRKDKEQRINKAWRVVAAVRKDVALMPARVLLGVTEVVPTEAAELGRAILESRGQA